MKLTKKEFEGLQAIIKTGLGAICGSKAEELLEDNMTWFDCQDIVKKTSLSKHQASGVMSALAEKGITMDMEGDGTGWCLSQEGVEAAVRYGL